MIERCPSLRFTLTTSLLLLAAFPIGCGGSSDDTETSKRTATDDPGADDDADDAGEDDNPVADDSESGDAGADAADQPEPDETPAPTATQTVAEPPDAEVEPPTMQDEPQPEQGEDPLPDAGPDEPPELEIPPQPEPFPNIWRYVAADDLAVVADFAGTNQIIVPQLDLNNDVYPWSPDGTQLALISEGELFIYELAEEVNPLARLDAQGYTEVRGWIPNFGPVLAGERDGTPVLGAMNADGTEVIFGEGAAGFTPYVVGAAPDGSEVIWSYDEEGIYHLLHIPFAGGSAGQAEQFQQAGSPALSGKFSPLGDWYAYGIGTAPEEGGIYLWRSELVAPIKVSPAGASYSPNFYFSADGSKLVMHVYPEEGPSLYTIALGEGPSEPQLVAQSPGVSPAYWSDEGPFLMYVDEDGGWLQQIEGDGTPAPRIQFPNYVLGTSCVVWLSPSQFIQTTCGEGGIISLGSVEADQLTLKEIATDGFGKITRSPGGACLMDWNASEIRVGPVPTDVFTSEVVRTRSAELSFVSFTPDGAGLVWTADQTDQYYVELSDCLPTGDPRQLPDTPGRIVATTFVTAPR